MTAKEVSSFDIVAMEEGRLPAEPSTSEAPHQSQSKPHCGRTYRWPIALSTTGVVASGVTIAVNATVASLSPTPLYVAVAFSTTSTLVHAIGGIVSCIQQPRKALEDNVAAVGKASDDVEKQLSALQQEVAATRALQIEQERQLQQERAATQAAREALDQRIARIAQLTEELQEVHKGLDAARQLAERWKSSTEQLAQQMETLQTMELEGNIEALTGQIQQLSLVKKSFSEGVHAVKESTDALQDTERVWGTMVDRLLQTFEGLAAVAVQKERLLHEADVRNQSLSERVDELQEVESRFQNITEKYDKLLKEMEEAKRQLSKLVPLIQSPEFQAFLKQFHGKV